MFEPLESRLLLAADFGDAPDLVPFTSVGNYSTLQTDNGPGHAIDTTQNTLFLGASVDGDSGTLQNANADADDIDGALPDDEDGVLDPLDLHATIGTQPTVTLLATNMTGDVATLFGWIDYNRDGVFHDTTERAQIAVPNGTIQVGALDATVTVNVQSAAGKLDAWIDFNGDGSWGGPGEQIFDSRDTDVCELLSQ